MLATHLCNATRDRRFREAFGISSRSASILWIYLNVENEGPTGGQRVHLLWTLLFLKTYGTQNDLAGRCGVHRDTFRAWRNLFLERIASIEDLVRHVFYLFGRLVVHQPISFLSFYEILVYSPTIRLTLKTDICLQIHIKFAKSQLMVLIFGFTNLFHLTQSGFPIR